MILVIEASNIKSGGGLLHLIQILKNGCPKDFGINQAWVFSCKKTLQYLPEKDWLIKKEHPWLNKGYIYRFFWSALIFRKSLPLDNYFTIIPGTGRVNFAPYITICRNLLPLDRKELNRYFFSFTWIRLNILRFFHLNAYKKAEGLIFLNKYCFDQVSKLTNSFKHHAIISHGLNNSFVKPKENYQIDKLNCNLLYVSIIDQYKHQWNIAQAVMELVSEGYAITLTLIGPSYPPAKRKLDKIINRFPENISKFIMQLGAIPHEQLSEYYSKADIYIMGSTCESYGMVLTEAMAAGLPIACSKYSSLPETLGNAGIYFDPLNILSVKEIIITLYQDWELRESLGNRAFDKAKQLSWEKCANETFSFISKVAKNVRCSK